MINFLIKIDHFYDHFSLKLTIKPGCGCTPDEHDLCAAQFYTL